MSDIKIDGLNEVIGEIESFADWERVQSAISKACALVEKAAKEKAPKGDGELRRSITSKIDGTNGVVFTPLEYAPYVEYGTGLFAEEQGRQEVPWRYKDDKGVWHSTSGMHPQPYMRPALYENREEILRIIKEGMMDND